MVSCQNICWQSLGGWEKWGIIRFYNNNSSEATLKSMVILFGHPLWVWARNPRTWKEYRRKETKKIKSMMATALWVKCFACWKIPRAGHRHNLFMKKVSTMSPFPFPYCLETVTKRHVLRRWQESLKRLFLPGQSIWTGYCHVVMTTFYWIGLHSTDLHPGKNTNGGPPPLCVDM